MSEDNKKVTGTLPPLNTELIAQSRLVSTCRQNQDLIGAWNALNTFFDICPPSVKKDLWGYFAIANIEWKEIEKIETFSYYYTIKVKKRSRQNFLRYTPPKLHKMLIDCLFAHGYMETYKKASPLNYTKEFEAEFGLG